MKVSGFTFIRNAIRYDYPVVEAITSILPLCDEFIVLCGNSEDATKTLIEAIHSPKIRIIDSIWDDSLREGGHVLAAETNKAMDFISPDSDWCFYIQADEVLHENYLSAVKKSMEQWKDDPEVEGLLFDFIHFYGSYDYIGDSTNWYRHEVRIVRNDPSIRSWKDAQGFRKNRKSLCVKKSNACIFHYGWVKPPEKQQEKQKYFHKLWHSDDWMNKNISNAASFDYSRIDSVARFPDTHPSVMLKRIQEKNWKFDFDPAQRKLSLKSKVKMALEKWIGWRIGEYQNYRIV